MDKDTELILTHMTFNAYNQVAHAFFAAWAKVRDNECLVIKFEVRPIAEPDEAGDYPQGYYEERKDIKSIVGYYEDNNE